MSKRNYRRKRVQDSDEEGEEDSDEAKKVSEILQDRKELQKFRTRPNGVSAEALLETEPIDVGAGQDSVVNDDPFKLKSGGGLTETKATTGTQFGTTFSAETNQRGDDASMMKYIEEGLKKKRGVVEAQDEEHTPSKEDLLYKLPEHINVQSSLAKTEEMLSSQMLSGIPEVDLGIEAKIKNIEATEEAKLKMIDESKNRSQQASVFVPTNMASNFMHHRRFLNEKEAFEKEKRKEMKKKQEESANAIVDKGPTVGKEIVESSVDTKYIDKAMHASGSSGAKKKKINTTDDYMYEKFKNRSKDIGRKK